MKKPRWKAVLRSRGYKHNKEIGFWKNNKKKTMIFDGEFNKQRFVHWLSIMESPDCEYCNGCGIEDTNGLYHGCTGCEGMGKDVSHIVFKELDKNENFRCITKVCR